MKKGFLTASMIFVSFCASAQSKQFLQERTQPILKELGMDSTQIRVFTIEAHRQRALFIETNNTQVIIDTLAKKFYFGLVADSVSKYSNISVIQYFPNQTPRAVNYDLNNRLFRKP